MEMKAKVINDLTFIDSELMDALDRDDTQSVAHLALDVIPRMVEEYNSTPQKQSVTIEGWVCKDRIGTYLCKYEPVRDYPNGLWSKINSEAIKLPTSSFPDLKWEDEPVKCRIRIEEI